MEMWIQAVSLWRNGVVVGLAIIRLVYYGQRYGPKWRQLFDVAFILIRSGAASLWQAMRKISLLIYSSMSNMLYQQ